MPVLELKVGGRNFSIACEDGQEETLRQAAATLDAEAKKLQSIQTAIPDDVLIAMSGIMVSNRINGLENKLAVTEDRMEKMQAELEFLRNQPTPESTRETVIETVIETPDEVWELLEQTASQLEELAEQLETSDELDTDEV